MSLHSTACVAFRPSRAADRLHMWSITLHPPGSASATWREHQLPPHSGPSDTAAGPAAAAWTQPAGTETPAPSNPGPPPACQSYTRSMPAAAEKVSSFNVQSATPAQRLCLQGHGGTVACNLCQSYTEHQHWQMHWQAAASCRACCAQSSSSCRCASACEDVLQSWGKL